MASEDRIERLIDFGVAALFALACAFPAFMLLPNLGTAALAVAALIGIAGFAAAVRVLGRIARRPRPPVTFELMALPEFPAVEPLELAAANLIAPEGAGELGDESSDPALELDVVLPHVGPDSRVVQLFGSPAQATAGELAVRIDNHLALRNDPSAGPPDASDELFEALSQLRRSLR